MDDEYEEYECYDEEYDEEKYLHGQYREKCEDTWYDEWDDEKKECYDDRTQIEQYHREVEFPSYGDMTQCHTSRHAERDECCLSFEYDEKLRICETHIQKKRKYEIDSHDDTDSSSIVDTKESKEEYIECDDRERPEYSGDIVYFEHREKVSKSIEKSLDCAVSFFPMTFSIAIYHLYDPTICYRFEECIEEKYRYETHDDFGEVLCMDKIRKCTKELIFFLKYYDVGIGNLVDEDTKKPEHSHKRWEKIQFFEWVISCDEFPGIENDWFFHENRYWWD